VDDIKLSADVFDYDYVSNYGYSLPYIDDVVKYISGFVVRKLFRNICHICSIFVTNSINSILITAKNSKLIFPSNDVIKITRYYETII